MGLVMTTQDNTLWPRQSLSMICSSPTQQSLVLHAMHGLRCWWETSPSATASGKLWLNCTTVVLTEHLTMCTCRLWLDGGLDVSVHRTEGIVSSISRVTCLLWKPGLGCNRMFGSCTSNTTSSTSCPQQCHMLVGQLSRAWRKMCAAVILQNGASQELSGMFGRCIMSLPRRSAQARCASHDVHTADWFAREGSPAKKCVLLSGNMATLYSKFDISSMLSVVICLPMVTATAGSKTTCYAFSCNSAFDFCEHVPVVMGWHLTRFLLTSHFYLLFSRLDMLRSNCI